MAIVQNSPYDYLLDYLVDKASPQDILAFELPQESSKREAHLIEKRRKAEISPEEARELSQLLEVEALISALQSRALHALDIATNFKQGWKEAMRGETYPISELWDDIDAE